MYSRHLLLWACHQYRLHSYFWHFYSSTEDRLLIASSRFELLRMYSTEVPQPIRRILVMISCARAERAGVRFVPERKTEPIL